MIEATSRSGLFSWYYVRQAASYSASQVKFHFRLGRVDKTWGNWLKDGPHSRTKLAKEGLSCDVTRSPMTTGTGSSIFCRDGKVIPGSQPRIIDCSSTQSFGSRKPGLPGGTCPNVSATGTACGGDSTAGPGRGLGNASSGNSRTLTWNGCCSIAPSFAPTSMLRAQKKGCRGRTG